MALTEKNTRFEVLDGLRGFAAVAVMLYHYTQHNGLQWFPGAWVAVDLFFVLSGFVIAHSYGARIMDGMTFRQFLLGRLIRLAPLYYVGLALGAVALLLTLHHGEAHFISTRQFVAAIVFGLAWLPFFNHGVWPFGADSIGSSIFPLDDPSWSLFFELFVNMVFFVYALRYRRVASVRFVLVAYVVWLLCIAASGYVNPGWSRGNFAYAFPRVTAEFFIGAMIYALCIHRKAVPPALAWGVGALALAGFAVESRDLHLLDALTLVPLTVALMSTLVLARPAAKRLCRVLGDLSYPVYVLHFPIYRLLYAWLDFRSITRLHQTLLAAAVCLVAALLLIPIDYAVRRRLTRRISVSRARLPAVTG